MRKGVPEEVFKWLQSNPSLDEISAEFPELRESTRTELAQLVADHGTNGITAYLGLLSQNQRILEAKYQGNRGDRKAAAALIQQAVRTRIANISVKQHLVSEATGIEKGKVRFNHLNAFIAQKLLFEDGLKRKPASLFWFRIFWPLLPQRRLLMPLVQPEGIYCFYSRQLLDELAIMISSGKCLEIAAGDGTLTRFLADRGVKITATDDYSWNHEVKYPGSVVRRDAGDALREYGPDVVICSWPPAGNRFEQKVFRTKSVQLYVVIGSRHRFAAGNWDDYLSQSAFEFEENEKLSALVIPPELDSAVYIFRRKQAGDGIK